MSFTDMPPEEQQKRQRRLFISYSDFFEARDFAREIPGTGNPADARDLFRLALTIAAVIAYCRPFNSRGDDETDGRLSEKYRGALLENERQLHDEILALRNQVYAHSDAKTREIEVLTATVGDQELQVPGLYNPVEAFSDQKARELADLAERVGSLVAHDEYELRTLLGLT